ncbi:MAG TPA: quinone-dependent dihydroorotate dehydrogenase [Burkholderiales bacterium]|jgi:dihydroorotate dehydrogenase|nr:quinone-dependent dihydroorotate dehydrogenase [Burkholderiales bacterium]
MLYRAARPLLFLLDAEDAHHHALAAFDRAHRLGLVPLIAGRVPDSPRKVMGLEFPNPVGLAAGLDKNGSHIDALAALGFGFLEIGTVTPRPQPGNPRPRMFRIPQARAIINRMGFNNLGVEKLLENVARARFRGILGINIGKNFDTPIERAAEDYLLCMRRVFSAASYITVNISSPNTQNLRRLQQADELDRLLEALVAERRKLAGQHGKTVPLAVKIAPDLTEDQVAQAAALFEKHGVDGVIATNTTLARESVAGLPHAGEPGGLSGAPLRARSTAVVRQLSSALGNRLPIIGVGGIFSAADAREKLAAGASLVQLYSGLVYEGPGLVARVAAGLATST